MESKHAKELASEKKQREEWENRYRAETTERALLDAAVNGDAFNNEIMISVLRPMTHLLEITDEKTGKGTGRFKPVVDFPGVDSDTGTPITIPCDPGARSR